MAYEPDIAAVAPALEVTIDFVRARIRCAGILDSRTARHVVAAVHELLLSGPASIVLDVGELQIADARGARILATVQTMLGDSGVSLRWQGVGSRPFGGVAAPPFRARRPRSGGAVIQRMSSRLGVGTVRPLAVAAIRVRASHANRSFIA
ncbi:MAG: STAS domain-containing protein [Actinomycetota bacterium]|jgi:hypothetical protein|nr:STAS domain-containing protein [Actinomycetota bacterium]